MPKRRRKARTTRTPALNLARTGYLYAGGRVDPSLAGSPMVGQMYAEFMIPQRQKHRYPIVMIHGGSQTGTNFTGTADGREGWAQYFARRGYAVYVADQVARGRSAHWSQSQGSVAAASLERTEQTLRCARALQAVAAGASAHAVSRHGQAGRSPFRCVLRHAVPVA